MSHAKNFPLNKLMPITEKIIKMRNPINKMFLIAVKEPKKALTTCFSFGELLMTLNGLSALRDLMALTAPILLLPTFISVATISMIEVTTINKSRQFQIDERYGGTWKK